VANNAPYLSVIVAARNDNHGGNMLSRMQAFLDCWIEQARRFNLSSEIVIVEWNPPAERPRLKDALRWPADLPCAVRFVEVPKEVHARFPHSEAIPLHQMIAKNAGIRRARGEFVLVIGPPAASSGIMAQDDLDELLRSALKRDSVKDAVAHAVEVSGRPRREIYARALELARQDQEDGDGED